nr:hypothetical protein [Providencia vermicola]
MKLSRIQKRLKIPKQFIDNIASKSSFTRWRVSSYRWKKSGDLRQQWPSWLLKWKDAAHSALMYFIAIKKSQAPLRVWDFYLWPWHSRPSSHFLSIIRTTAKWSAKSEEEIIELRS